MPFENRCLVDGGIADPVPVRRAYERGARRVLLIRTIGVNGEDASSWRHRLDRIRRVGAMPKTLAGMLERHEAVMEETEAFIADPPADLELVQVAPRATLCSQVFGSRSESLVADYRIGRAEGRRALANLKHWRFEPIRPALTRRHAVISPSQATDDRRAGV